jgi:predicted CoA-binding protein
MVIGQYQADYSKILKESRSIAVVGLSPKETRPSHQVAQYLIEQGYSIFPVNPGQGLILGLTCFPDLLSVPAQIDIVDIFRNPKDVPGIVDSAIEIGAKIVWMQLGVVHEVAAAKARAAGLIVVMDRCLKIDHQHLLYGG